MTAFLFFPSLSFPSNLLGLCRAPRADFVAIAITNTIRHTWHLFLLPRSLSLIVSWFTRVWALSNALS